MNETVIIFIGLVELAIAFGLGVYLLVLMFKQFRPVTEFQYLKWLLLSAVIFLMLSSIPLMVTYANSIWFHQHAIQVINVTILMNATALIVTKLILITIYRHRK